MASRSRPATAARFSGDGCPAYSNGCGTAGAQGSAGRSCHAASTRFGDGVICFVNGLGGTPLIELYVVYAEVVAILEKAGIGVARSLVGPYMTSLEMAGCSVTLLQADDELLRLWDAPVRTPGLRWGV